VLVIEAEERELRAWDFVHCPAGAVHVIVGAGEGSCVVLAVGARDPDTAYGRFPDRRPTRYRDGWLSGPPSANAS
jgi:uncharacterized cupin superfamily protein